MNFFRSKLGAHIAAAVLAAGLLPIGAQPPVVPGPVRAGRFVVVLDAAHGGEDGGAQVGGSVAEKTVTLALSVRLRSLLTARGFSVATTREGNVAVEDLARIQIANRAVANVGGSACLTLHATQVGSGAHLYVSSLQATVPTRFLPWKTAQSAFITRSLKLASVVNSALEHSSVGDAADGRKIPLMLGRTSLPGLDSLACPAVALEVAPIRGSDGKVLTEVTDEQYQTQIVEALAAAMMEWRTNSPDSPPDAAAAGGQKP